jgi:hypothetical protein
LDGPHVGSPGVGAFGSLAPDLEAAPLPVFAVAAHGYRNSREFAEQALHRIACVRVAQRRGGPGIGFGHRFAHSTASSIERTCQTQNPATSSLASVKGPSVSFSVR